MKSENRAGLVVESVRKGFQMPTIKELTANVDIHDSVSTIRLSQVYENPDTNGPIEVTYQFPKEKESVIAKMTVTIGDKSINTKVVEKASAQEKYDDAIASGN